MPFQNTIPAFQQAPAVTGDFATNNPRSNYPSIQAGFISGIEGIITGQFVWIQPDGVSVLNHGLGSPDGYVAREFYGVITNFLAESSMYIEPGTGLAIFRTGDFWMINNVTVSLRGQKVYANNLDGTMQTAPTGVIIPGYSETNFYVAVGANINELAVISFLAAADSFPISPEWFDEFGGIWVDEFSDPWTSI